MQPKVIVVAGPTACGKTRLGIALAQELGGEIVSADSMQVYRRMDIGTAKATAEERAAAPHHMLDVAEPWEDYSVARYVEAAAACCDDILRRGKLPIIVGGTGLYIDSLLSGRDFAAREEGDEKLRASLAAEYEALGGEALLQRLRSFDPERAGKLHPADKRRIIRAIEIYTLTGTTITEHDRRSRELPRALRGRPDRPGLCRPGGPLRPHRQPGGQDGRSRAYGGGRRPFKGGRCAGLHGHAGHWL